MRALVFLLLGLSTTSSACSYFPDTYKVSRDFKIHLVNSSGNAVGITLRIGGRQVQTDALGLASFHLQDGNYTVEVIHPAARLSWWGIEVSSEDKNSELTISWPQKLLVTSTVSGTILDGLYSSKSKPLEGATLSLHDARGERLADKAQVVGSNGHFDFPRVVNGLYFLRVDGKGLKNWDENSWNVRGYIPVLVSQAATPNDLRLAVAYSSCGMDFDLEANKEKYKPEFCMKGMKQIPCDY